MDGINGITGGYSLVILGALAYINSEITTFVEPALINTVLCAVLVFFVSSISVRRRSVLRVMSVL